MGWGRRRSSDLLCRTTVARFSKLAPDRPAVNDLSRRRSGRGGDQPIHRTATNMKAAPRQVRAMRPAVKDERLSECASGRTSEDAM